MPKKPKKYLGDLPPVPGTEIYLNINKLAQGEYTLKIIQDNRVITKTTFKK
tara:strand:+ start:2025 stop:2177 length:153 start_codon:yes stop_codon:yes gene_type:complete